MKYLLLLLVLMAIVFISGVRKGRAGAASRERRDDAGAPAASGRAPRPSPLIVACAECGTHLPEGEALPGRGGHFCSAEHRARHEARQGHG